MNDDKTIILGASIEYYDQLGNEFNIQIEQLIDREIFKCTCLRNGKEYGASMYAQDQEGVFAWMRLILGNYPASYRGAA